MSVLPLVLAVILVTPAAALAAQQPASATHSPSDSTPIVHGIDRADFDTTCAACKDFYQYATGGWRAHNPVPAAYPEWGTLDVLQEHNRLTVRLVLEDAARDAGRSHTTQPPGTTGGQRSGSAGEGIAESATGKVGTFYATCMDSAATESQGLSPLEPELKRIAAVTTLSLLRREAAQLQTQGVGVVFGINSQQDAKESREVIAVVSQGGLGLPDRDYYLKTDSVSTAIRTAYVGHIARVLALAGDDNAAASAGADRVMALETALARIARPRTPIRSTSMASSPGTRTSRTLAASKSRLRPSSDRWRTRPGSRSMDSPLSRSSSCLGPVSGPRPRVRSWPGSWSSPTPTPRAGGASMARCRTCRSSLPHSTAKRRTPWSGLPISGWRSGREQWGDRHSGALPARPLGDAALTRGRRSNSGTPL